MNISLSKIDGQDNDTKMFFFSFNFLMVSEEKGMVGGVRWKKKGFITHLMEISANILDRFIYVESALKWTRHGYLNFM